MGAVVISISAVIICFYATNFIKRSLHIDDSLDVFSVHGVGGIIGTMLTAVFVSKQFGGVGLADGVTIGQQPGTQAFAVVVVIAWTLVATFVALKIAGLICELRVSNEEERNGLDITQHEEKGYNI